MIKINFHLNGAYITGHDIDEICGLVSYAMWSCTNDCYKENENITFYESINDEEWSHLGFTYIKVDEGCKDHLKLLNRFKENITYWLNVLYPNRVRVITFEDNIDWNKALQEAKQYHIA